MAATVQLLSGDRLHLSEGPIDVVLKAFGVPEAVAAAHRAAALRFASILSELCAELPLLRSPVSPGGRRPASPVGRRMHAACLPFADRFVTPMAAVAGAVADELLATMRAAAPLTKAFVNDGGDVAVFCAPGETLEIAVAGGFGPGPLPALNGSLRIAGGDGIGGVATSGARGRSFSLGVADSVTLIAADAATADVAATLVANAVDLDHPAIRRAPAASLDPDSDLGHRSVVTAVGPLDFASINKALDAGRARALEYAGRGLVRGAALMLQGEVATAGAPFAGMIERKAS